MYNYVFIFAWVGNQLDSSFLNEFGKFAKSG